MPLLEVDDLSVGFEMYTTRFNREVAYSVRHVTLQVSAGEVLGVAGASGSGKSLLAHTILGLLPGNAIQSGRVVFDGAEITPKTITAVRNQLALVPQSVTYLDPLMPVRKQLVERPRRRQPGEEELELIAGRFSLERSDLDKIPSELSGGMIRRVLLATAMLTDARVVIADEPTPGIPVAMAAGLLSGLRELADEGRGVILISHDVDLIAHVADRMAVLRDGRLVTTLSADAFSHPDEHDNDPYAEALWRSLPQNDFDLTPSIQEAG